MVRRSYRPDEIINNRREAEVLLSEASTVDEASRRTGITDETSCH